MLYYQVQLQWFHYILLILVPMTSAPETALCESLFKMGIFDCNEHEYNNSTLKTSTALFSVCLEEKSRSQSFSQLVLSYTFLFSVFFYSSQVMKTVVVLTRSAVSSGPTSEFDEKSHQLMKSSWTTASNLLLPI